MSLWLVSLFEFYTIIRAQPYWSIEWDGHNYILEVFGDFYGILVMDQRGKVIIGEEMNVTTVRQEGNFYIVTKADDLFPSDSLYDFHGDPLPGFEDVGNITWDGKYYILEYEDGMMGMADKDGSIFINQEDRLYNIEKEQNTYLLYHEDGGTNIILESGLNIMDVSILANYQYEWDGHGYLLHHYKEYADEGVGMTGYMDDTGTIIFEPQYDGILWDGHGFILEKDISLADNSGHSYLSGYANDSGEMIIPFEYKSVKWVSPYFILEGFLHSKDKYIDETEKMITSDATGYLLADATGTILTDHPYDLIYEDNGEIILVSGTKAEVFHQTEEKGA